MDAIAPTLTVEDAQRLVHELRVHQIELESQNEALQDARHESEEALARYTELYDFAPVGYVTLDRNGLIKRANRAAIALLRTTPELSASQRLGAFVADESLPDFTSFLERILSGKDTEHCEVALKSGEREPNDVVILEGLADITGQDCIVAMVNITERKRAQDALLRAKEIAERATSAKSRFLAAASHDLRQPLQTLYLICGVMARRFDDPRLRELLASQDQALDVMSGMLNTLLDINQIDAGLTTPQPIGFRIAVLLERLERDFAFHAGTGGNTWRVVSSHLFVHSDPKILEQILRNLLSNAFKYTHHGKVLLGCRRRGNHLSIEVCDTGIGIAENQIDSIFNEFVQIETPSDRQNCGLGLGLSIVKREVELLGHTLKVRSQPGRGSVFSIEVPLAEAETPITVPGLPPFESMNAAIRQRRILVVEDDIAISSMMNSLFTAEGATVTVTSNAATAISLAAVSPRAFDLVVTDYTLRDGPTGLDLISRLRTTEQPDLPVILLTGDISTTTLRKIGTHTGCIHMTKPVSTTQLLHAAGVLLSRTQRPGTDARSMGPTIFVIDDDEALRQTMGALLTEEGRSVESYPNAEAFLNAVGSTREGCLLVDAVMPGMGGLELLKHLRSQNRRLPAIVMTGHGDITMAVTAMKAGATDFVSKPLDPEGLLAAVDRALEQGQDLATESIRRNDAIERMSSLTPREYDVLEQLLAGHRNKTIAHCLGISQRTVENHRASVMRKTKSKALLDLLRTVIDANRST
ncbi:Hybrid two-component sensor-regulator transcriptional histidine kinase fixJ (modular protein) [Magnetospirillum molischianum DSM 120]|uniref:histidine kinase n=1 Tax=Magnetospirillum molischianum DSM 120 TaxID=1150626 RepID=H8FVM4_MAGML|nr:Hybrid two-component sensor-regulator transcriptional histidine kinase fixJ (modular protein) [Magnetospirillum molischianum DSM 120]